MKKIEGISKVNLVDRVAIFITLFFIFFPWLSFGLNDLDTQPWPIITNSLFILTYSGKKIKKFIVVGYVILTMIFLIIFLDFKGESIRGFFTYLMFFSTLHVLYIVFKRFSSYFYSLVPKFNLLWLIAGAAQLFFGKNVLSFLVAVRTSEDRGVTGLAPEPTHYAFFLLFISWLLVIFFCLCLSPPHPALH